MAQPNTRVGHFWTYFITVSNQDRFIYKIEGIGLAMALDIEAFN